MKRIMSAHQPNFLPYLGFFDKMISSDIFVIRDEVQFVERDYHHRNRIRIQSPVDAEPQCRWVRVPVAKEEKELKDIRIRNDVKDKNVPWNLCMLRQIRSNYEKAPCFSTYFSDLDLILRARSERLIDLNMAIIDWLKGCFAVDTEIVYARQLGYRKTGDPTRDLVEISRAVDADVYLSGSGGRAYLDRIPFDASGIELRFQSFEHPVYEQRYAGFIPNLAAIDALFNVGNIFGTQPVAAPASEDVSLAEPLGVV